MDDEELIAAVAGGDDAALRELFSRHAPWLAARLRAVLPAADVEDVLQETFLAVWRGAAAYRREGAGGWLWGIARRQAALWLRRRGPAELLLAALADGRRPARRPTRRSAALSRAELADAVDGAGAGGQPAARDLAADVRRGQDGGRGGRADGCSRGHGEEPRVPGPPADARGAAAPRAGARRRRAMTSGDGRPADEPAGADPAPARRRSGPGLDRGGRAGVAPPPGAVERLAGRLLRSPGLARALVTTPSLLLGWVIATAVVLVAGVLATREHRDAVRGAPRARGRRGGHRLRLRPGDRPRLGAVVQHGGQRPDGAAGPGAGGVRR